MALRPTVGGAGTSAYMPHVPEGEGCEDDKTKATLVAGMVAALVMVVGRSMSDAMKMTEAKIRGSPVLQYHDLSVSQTSAYQ